MMVYCEECRQPIETTESSNWIRIDGHLTHLTCVPKEDDVLRIYVSQQGREPEVLQVYVEDDVLRVFVEEEPQVTILG